MIKKLRIKTNYVLCLLLVIGFFISPNISPPKTMGCESVVGDVCTG